MKHRQPIAVTCFEFFNNPTLKNALTSRYQHIKFNEANRILSGNLLIDFLSGYKKAILGNQPITPQLLNALPELKVISRFGHQLDPIDLSLLKKHKIQLHTSYNHNRQSIAELNIALILNLLRHIHIKPMTHGNPIGRQLSDCTVGIIGLGQTGQILASLLRHFGARVLAFDQKNHFAFCASRGIYAMCLRQLLRSADIVSLNIPSNKTQTPFLDAQHLALMPAHSLLINTSDPHLVDIKALYQQLKSNTLAGAAFDAKSSQLHELLVALDNVISTPNIAAHTQQIRLQLGHDAIIGLENAKIPSKINHKQNQP